MSKRTFVIILAALIVTGMVAGFAVFGMLHINNAWLAWAGQYDYSTTTTEIIEEG